MQWLRGAVVLLALTALFAPDCRTLRSASGERRQEKEPTDEDKAAGAAATVACCGLPLVGIIIAGIVGLFAYFVPTFVAAQSRTS